MSGPIFLAGVDRSGIGLLGEVLETHPQVSLTRRTNYWSYYYRRFGDLGDTASVERALDEMMRNSRMRVLEPDRPRLHADLSGSIPTYPRLFELLQLQLMERRGCSRWGDKSLSTEHHAHTILTAYPDAKIVHVIRDPRDRYASHKHHRGPSRGDVGAGTALWRWSDTMADANRKRFSGRYHVVRYEDLVTDTDRVLEEIRSFLDLEVPARLVTGTPMPLSMTSIGRFRHDITPTECRFIELTTRRRMMRRGYEVRSVVVPVSGTLRFWTRDVPVQLVNAALWRLMTEIRRQRGRTPSPRRLVHQTTVALSGPIEPNRAGKGS